MNSIRNSVLVKLSEANFKPYVASYAMNNYKITSDELANPKRFAELVVKYQTYTDDKLPNNIPRRMQRTFVEFAMLNTNINWIEEVFVSLGLNNLNATIDVFFDFLWYISMSRTFNFLSKDELSYVSSLNMGQLRELLGRKYNGPEDHASLLFAATTGLSIPNYNINLKRLEEIKHYKPESVWLISAYRRIINPRKKYVSPYGPYLYSSMFDKNSIEIILSVISPDNIEEFIERYGVSYPDNKIYDNRDNLFMYVSNELSSYDNVLNRDAYIIPSADSDYNLFTNKELIDYFEPIDVWNGRIQLINQLTSASEYKVWSYRNKWCENKSQDVLILSYGTPMDYKCYTVNELIENFGPDEYGFYKFRVPNSDSTFPVTTVEQLQTFLSNNNVDNTTLLNLINRQIDDYYQTKDLLNNLVLSYNILNAEDKLLIQIYLTFAFLICLYAYGWKGYGTKYPEMMGEKDGLTRIVESKIYQLIKNNIKEKRNVNEILGSLPIVYYDKDRDEVFQMKDDRILGLAHLLSLVVNEEISNDYVRILLGSLYYYFDKMLNIYENVGFNAHLDNLRPIFVNYEREILGELLGENNNREVIVSRILELDRNDEIKPLQLENLIR